MKIIALFFFVLLSGCDDPISSNAPVQRPDPRVSNRIFCALDGNAFFVRSSDRGPVIHRVPDADAFCAQRAERAQ